MGIIKVLKSVTSTVLGSDRSERSDGDGSVTVEHEPDATSEAAVKGTDDESAAGSTDEPAAAGTDAGASTGSMAEEPPETPVEDEVAEAAEPAEAAGPATQTTEEVAGDADTGGGVESEGGGAELVSVSGIGEAYANRLREAGIEDVDGLVAADAASLAEDTGIGQARIERWQDRAGGD